MGLYTSSTSYDGWKVHKPTRHEPVAYVHTAHLNTSGRSRCGTPDGLEDEIQVYSVSQYSTGHYCLFIVPVTTRFALIVIVVPSNETIPLRDAMN